MNDNRDPLGTGPGAIDPDPHESVGPAPRPVEPVPAAPPANVMPEPALPRPGAGRSDEQVGSAPGADEQVGNAPPAEGNRSVALLVGAVVAVIVILAIAFGAMVK